MHLGRELRRIEKKLRSIVKKWKQPSDRAQFDEEFYRAFYQDVDKAIASGRFRSGKVHFLKRGHREGRLPKYDSAGVLERRLPGITTPKHFSIVKQIQRRLCPVDVVVDDDAAPTFWVLLPHFNPDIVFGGYAALYEFIVRAKAYLAEAGFATKLLVTDETEANTKYFHWHPAVRKYREAVADLDIRGLGKRDKAITISSRDIFLAYSAWDAYPAAQMAAQTRNPKFIQFIQEYEPIFHDHSALRAVCAGGFDLDSFPIFNSDLLRKYFEQQQLGIFRNGPVQSDSYFVFEHIISAPEPDIRERADKTMLLYTRPEGHAARNLYEFLELVLSRLCTAGIFGPEWRFIGVGPLTQLKPRKLGGGHQLVFHAKMPPDEYKKVMQTADIGVSLMYAPHPGVVSYEMAATGALVVTNTFNNRDEAYYAGISKNIIACKPELGDLERAILQAIERVNDIEGRQRNIYRTKSSSWSEIFNEAALEQIFRRFL